MIDMLGVKININTKKVILFESNSNTKKDKSKILILKK